MSIDIEEMVRMAGERVNEKWEFVRLPILGVPSDTIRYTNEDGVSGLLLAEVVGDTPAARFIADAPAAILALHQRVQDVEAQIAALQRAGAWQGVDVVPPTEFQNASNGREVTNSEEVDVLVRVRAFRQEVRFHDGMRRIEWINHHANTAYPHDRVLGWRPLPDEPTAAESEE